MQHFVLREANPDDRRSAYAVLTTEGRNEFRRAAPSYLRGIAQHFGDALTPDQLIGIRDGLERVIRREAGRSPA